MPSLLSRFRRSPSRSSDHSVDETSPSSPRHRRESTASSSVLVPSTESDEDHLSSASNTVSSVNHIRSGSVFVEDIPNTDTPPKHQQQSSFSSGRKNIPSPLVVPNSGLKPALGTPKLVLTEEGSNSPHSFTDSPGFGTSPTTAAGDSSSLGLGLGRIVPVRRGSASGGEDNAVTPTTSSPQPVLQLKKPTVSMNGQFAPSVDIYAGEGARPRSGSVLSANTRHSRSGSIVDRLSGKHHSPVIPSATSRTTDESHKKKKKGKKGKKERTRSVSSAVSGANSSIAAALAKSGLHIASPVDTDIQSSAHSTSRHSKRSPFLVRGKEADDDSYMRAEGDDEASRLDIHDYEDEDDDEDESDSDLDEHLPVTGFAVASNRRQHEFHGMFPAVDEGDYLIEDYGCALSKDILVQGRLYVSENHLCFHANIFGWVTDLVVPFTEIRTIEKKMTALVIPNAIGVQTGDAKYTFASFISRDSTFDVMMNIWRLCNPNAVMSTTSFAYGNGNNSRPASVHEDAPGSATTAGTAAKSPRKGGHAKTECACGRDGKHYSETAMDAVFQSTPEKTYNLMFNSEWYKKFLSENQKLRDVEMSDWNPSLETKNLTRSLSYIKPLNGSIGPKQTKCHITDEHQVRDFDSYISMLTTTKTPDVPSGGVFSVKTRSCITWAGPNSTRILVTTTVEWTGKSWVKGIIEKSAIEGQKSYHEDLEKGMKAYMKEHPIEFAGEGGAVEEEETKVEDHETKQPTEAAAYAAQQRKERQDRGYWSMQGGLDSVLSGLGSIGSGLKAVFDALMDIISDIPLSKETLFGSVILILIVSNVYTYFAFKTTRESVQARRAEKMGYEYDVLGAGEENVEDAVRRILGERKRSPVHEARELERILEGVEVRFNKLKSAVREVRREVEDGKRGVNDLD